MKLRKVLAAASALAVAVCAAAVTTVTSAAAVFEGSDSAGQFVCLVSNDTNVPVLENSALVGDVTKLVLTVKCNDYRDLESSIAAAEWYGGGVGTNSTSTGWAQKEWSFQEGVKDFTFVAGEKRGEYVLTWDNGAPFFTAAEEYAFFWIQDWTGTYSFTIKDFQLLNAEGVDVRTLDGAAAPEETPAPAETEAAPAPAETEAAPAETEAAPAETEAATETAAETESAAVTESAAETESAVETESEEEPAANTDAEANDGASKGSPDTGVAGVAVAVGAVALAGVAVVASRKRK